MPRYVTSHDQTFMVFALARPDVHETFPDLWRERNPHEFGLGDLSRKACERLVREILGQLPAEHVERLVVRSGGNAFYLEELVRAVSEGRADELPGTVLAVASARLEALEPETRKVLRAASVFGRVFRAGGVRALLGDASAASLPQQIEKLLRHEVIVRRSASKVTEDDELAFRHDLVREAAYAMLTDADRTLGHGLAGVWLEEERRGGAARSRGAISSVAGIVQRRWSSFVEPRGRHSGGNDFDGAIRYADRD